MKYETRENKFKGREATTKISMLNLLEINTGVHKGVTQFKDNKIWKNKYKRKIKK